MLFWSIAYLQFCASLCPVNWLSYGTYLRHTCTLFYSFGIVYWTKLSKVLCAEHQVLVEYLLQRQISMYIGEKSLWLCQESGDNLCILSKSDIHLCLNLKSVSLCCKNYFPCIFLLFCLERISYAFFLSLSGWVLLDYIPSRSILVIITGIIS